MSEEINYDKLSYDERLRFARGSAKAIIPKMCAALKRENPNYTNYDIREIVTKDCLPIWQKSTIVDAMPEEYKQKEKVEYGKKGREMQLEQTGSQQSTEFASFDENGNIQPANLRAESGSLGPVEDVSEDFSKMNRGPDVITEKERAKMLSKELEEAESERSMLRHEIDDLKNQVKVLKEKNTPELLKEIDEKF